MPTEPVLFISGVTRAGGRFSVEVNDVPGAALSFWRSLNLTVWEQVPNAVAEVDGFTLRITDPAAPGEGAFYKIELSPGKTGAVASLEFGH